MSQEIADSLSRFLFACPTPFHAVEQSKEKLLEAGFRELFEEDSWGGLSKAKPGEGFFCLRGGSLIVWLCGSEAPWQSGLSLAGAHTDSPCLKLKTESAHFDHGVLACHVSVYGSPIFATHTDRSLAVAGIAVTSDGRKSKLRHIHVQKPVALLPNLAIHLNREANSKLSYNAQTQLKAVFGQEPGNASGDESAELLLRRKLGLADTETCELQLCSSQKPELIGLDGELLSGARLDDMSMVCLLLDEMRQLRQKNCQPDKWPVAVFCNGEEVGSHTYEGAASNFVADVLQRIVRNAPQVGPELGQKAVGENSGTVDGWELWVRTQARSFLLSLDGAHAGHPSYPEAFDPNYDLKMGGGPALKLPNGASYSSEPFSIAHIRAVAATAGCRLQSAVPRSDRPTGSTIGPILSGRLGIRGVDIGLPMYAMHSIQETVSMQDYLALQKLVHRYFR
ncbi:M18 family aminopeptidase [Candidatus Haliotispira prima]|uniref:M18 family aminopeptidase n=1 Tax=Candidatus Haliotispira prima TaxID=3034016 RepID=A0ABY8MJQ6_9SPIO|nr:M18 family aminopeptidase [Candidatus Haliotispira prima]